MIDKVLFNFLGSDKKKVFLITFMQIINLLFSVSISALLCFIVYKVMIQEYVYLYFLFGVIILVLFKFLFYYLIGKIQSNLGNNVQNKLRREYLSKIFKLQGDVKKYNMQSVASLAIEGIEQLNLYYTLYIPQFFYSMISPLILFVIFCFINVPMALVFLICVPLIPLSIILVSKYAKKIFNKYWDKYLSMGDDFLDNLKGMKELKIFDYDHIQQEKMDQKAEEFRKITMKVLVMQLYSTSIMDFIAFGGAGLGIVIGLNAFLNAGIASFALVLFVILVGAEFFLPMRGLGSAFHISMNGASAGRKIIEILNLVEKENGKAQLDNINSISFKNIKVKYDDNIALDDINISIKEKGLYGIAGLSGSGKSTLIKTLSLSSLDMEGKIYINDLEINKYDKYSYFAQVSFISYQSHLFNRSIRENFKLINPNIEDNEIYNYLKLVKLDEFEDLDFVFKDESNISGGQKQRFILSMYLSLNKDVYIFDEATSNIDKESEEIIMNLIYELSKKKIVIMITHYLYNLKPASYIYFLEKGKITEQGDFNSLIALNKEFYHLFKLQEDLIGGEQHV